MKAYARTHVIHVNADPTDDVASAEKTGAVVRGMQLAGLRSVDDLCDRAAEAFEIPYPIGGTDGLIDWLSDLAWLGVERGVVTIFDASDAPADLVELVAGMLPSITERRRSQSIPFTLHLVGVADTAVARRALDEGNDALERFAALPWNEGVDTGPVLLDIR